MNSIDLFKYPRFPLAVETIDFLQQMALIVSKASGIGGENFILSGCVEAGSNVSSGFIVIAGEVMPFVGGAKETYIVVEETKRGVTAEGQVFEDIYISRQARFGTGSGQVEWSIFKTISIAAIVERIETIIPTGVIVMWAGTVVPDGWALCDGSNGTPDLQGRFIVGQKPGDPEFETKGNLGGLKKVGLSIAQLPSHDHHYFAPITNGPHPGGSGGYDRPNAFQGAMTDSTGGGQTHENLPPYYVLAYIMKV